MRREVLVNGRKIEMNGTPGADVREVEPGVFSVLLDGRSYEARLHDGFVTVCGERIRVAVVDPRELEAGGELAGAGGRAEVAAPMPGRVIRLLVEEGAEVAEGQGLLVVEAMKMQNEMPSPRAGRVSALRVAAGDAVAAGQVLAVVE